MIGGLLEDSNTNEHGIAHRRGFTTQNIQPIPDLRSGLNSPPSSAGLQGRPPFQGQYMTWTCALVSIVFIHDFYRPLSFECEFYKLLSMQNPCPYKIQFVLSR